MIAPFMSVLLVLIAMGVATFGALGLQQLKLLPQQICRVHQLSLQKNSLATIQLLEAMNIEVESLRAAKTLAEAELTAAIASGDAGAVAAITARIEEIEAQQENLQAEQRSALESEKNQAQRELSQVQAEIQQGLDHKLQLWQFLVRFEDPVIETGDYGLAMEPDIDDDSEPALYTKKRNFSQAQSSEASWKFKIFPRQGSEILSRDWPRSIEISDNCKASIKERSGSWQATLVL